MRELVVRLSVQASQSNVLLFPKNDGLKIQTNYDFEMTPMVHHKRLGVMGFSIVPYIGELCLCYCRESRIVQNGSAIEFNAQYHLNACDIENNSSCLGFEKRDSLIFALFEDGSSKEVECWFDVEAPDCQWKEIELIIEKYGRFNLLNPDIKLGFKSFLRELMDAEIDSVEVAIETK